MGCGHFEAWSTWRNGISEDDPVPGDILTSSNAVALNKWLLLFATEARKQDCTRYPSKTVNLLLAGLKDTNSSYPNFLNEKGDRFTGLCSLVARPSPPSVKLF